MGDAGRLAAPSSFAAVLSALLCCAAPPADDPEQQDSSFVCVSEEDCDGDGHPRGPDCDDLNAAVHPGAQEVRGNVRDDDCDPTTLDGDRIELPAAAGLFWEPVPTDVAGAGSQRVGALDLAQSAGTVVVDGVGLVAFIDERVPWPDYTYTIYQVLALGPEQLITLWAYCNADQLEWLYLGGVDAAPLTDEPASGTCTEHAQDAWIEVDVPALGLPLPPLVEGFSVDGPALRVVSGAPGLIRRDDFVAALLPFRVVDCSTECGTPGWYELHSLLWDQSTPSAAFGIVYLYLDPSLGRGRDVAVLSSRSLPDLGSNVFPDYAFFDADFTVP